MGLANELTNKIDVYGKTEIENELHEKDYKYDKITSIWAKISPSGGNLKSNQGNTIYADISHTIVIRVNSVSNLSNDMYFMFKGQRYDIKYYNPNYKHRDRIEIMCSLVVE